MSQFPDHAQFANLGFIEELYHAYLKDPQSVDLSWRHFFEGMDVGSYLYKRGIEPKEDTSSLRIYELIQTFRKEGHLLAAINPLEMKAQEKEFDLKRLGFLESEQEKLFPTLGFCGKKEAPLKEIIAALKQIYCKTIGFEYMSLGNQELEKWIQGRIEPELLVELSFEEKHLLLDYLNQSEIFETFLHTKYVGQTRFSLEGAETMIPLLAEIIDYGGDLGIEEIVIGMAHRGRLNVLTHILNKPLELIFTEFEDDTTLSFSGNDDVRYHMGFSGEFKGRSKRKVKVEMAANPSHLESVDPIVLGQTYAKQMLKKDREKTKVCPLLIHGDASIAGQGVVYESMQLMHLPSYSVGGTIHLIVNNQIGYTTLPQEGRSTRYCSDLAKAFSCPVFHVNAEDPESCLFVAKLAVEIRQKFHCDVFIDLLCYRKYGHNEGDEPSFTQPLQYQKIREKKGIRHLYVEALFEKGKLEKTLAESLEIQFKDKMKEALLKAQQKIKGPLSLEKKSASLDPFEPFVSKVEISRLQKILEVFCQIPEGFHLHPKLQKWLSDRLQSLEKTLDWATAECLAFGSLLQEGIPIRLAGQDAQRGTFSQRHMIWIDRETASPYCPLCQFQAPFEIVNSALTEYAGMGFEVGYSFSNPSCLSLWEAQYGDFNNGAQIIIDQYIAGAEQKWSCSSSLVLLLPHGYEGAGPEHSSARIERFLQLCAHNNMQVVYPSTPAQYFHLLRRQALRSVKRPLIVFTPKSLLRSSLCTSPKEAFTEGRFEEILEDPAPPSHPRRMIFCSGKIFYDLFSSRKEKETLLIRIEQLYPLHVKRLKEIIQQYSGVQEYLWVQEEPANMGAWSYIAPHLQSLLPKIQYVGRFENATTATGSSQKHKQEQIALVAQALGKV